ncbi:MAG: ABC transporter permease [Acidobacteria bacterium]|nr:ABC transporter permease [Acidobacteriota bacterium]
MQTFLQDFRYGGRILFKNPGFTVIAIVTLALGIGANTALFSLIDKLILQPLSVHDPASLVQLKSETVNPKLTFREVSWADFQEYRARNTVFSDLTAYKSARVNLGEGDQLERVRAELIAENYFSLFGINPLLGRPFSAEENRVPSAAPVVVLSHSLWQSRFGGAANVLGQTVVLNDHRFTVVGIAPANFRGIQLEAPTDLWVPAMMLEEIEQKKTKNEWLTKHDFMLWKVIGRLKPGMRIETAEAAMDTLARQVQDSWMPENDRHLPFNEQHLQFETVANGISSLREEMGAPLLYVFGIVGVILLIACANLANLLLARAATRRKEVAVRLALGAGRMRLVRQLLTESLLLAGLGGLLGGILAPWLAELLLAFQTRTENPVTTLGLSLNWRVAGFAFGVSLLTGVLFGLLPAWQSSKTDLIPALKDEGAMRIGGRGFSWTRRSLIVTQVALSFAVLVSAGLFVRTLTHLLAIDPGFNLSNVLAADIELPEGKYDEARVIPFFQQLQEKLRALPGVQSVAAADYSPLSGSVGLSTVLIEGQTVSNNEMPTVDLNTVSAGYHELLGISIEQGRSFTEQDRQGQPGVVTINAAFAKKFFPDQNPIGKRISLGRKSSWLTIIGVTSNIRSMSLDSEDRPQAEIPLAQQNAQYSQRILLRVNNGAAALLPQVRRTVRAMDAGLSFFKATTLEGDLRSQLASQRMAATLTGLFGLVALLLTAIGLYGVIAFAVSQRTREIGIRRALGAQSSDVLQLILGEGLLLLVTGLLLGLGCSLVATRLIKTFLYGVGAYDLTSFAGAAGLLILVALFACLIPARRATKVDPMIALRYE